jgi:hypothetical protein
MFLVPAVVVRGDQYANGGGLAAAQAGFAGRSAEASVLRIRPRSRLRAFHPPHRRGHRHRPSVPQP